MSEEQEVINEIARSPENIAAAFHVSNAMTALKRQLLLDFKNKLKNRFDLKGYELVWDEGLNSSWRAWVGFGVKFDNQDKYLRIEFEAAGLSKVFWGISRDNKTVERDNDKWQEINAEMQKLFWQGKQYDAWPWCSTIPDPVFDKDFHNWGVSEKPWIEIANGQLVEKIVDLADRVFNGFQDSRKIHLLQAKSD